MRERSSAIALAPHSYLHVWWARRPLVASRAAILASLLPAGFDRVVFERLIGFSRPADELVEIKNLMDAGIRVDGGFGGGRAFSNSIREDDLLLAHDVMKAVWNHTPTVIDPMAGGGSIPLEATRLGLVALANEYNPVACSVLEATVDFPFRFGIALATKTRKWANLWEERVAKRLASFLPTEPLAKVQAYIYARTVPCPDTGYATPLVPDWSLVKPKGGVHIVAEPMADMRSGSWTIKVREVGKGAGQLSSPPNPSYKGGSGVSIFTGTVISSDYIKAMAQSGRMGSALYAVAYKRGKGKLEFRPAEPSDIAALNAAEYELQRLRADWENNGIIPTERIPNGSKTGIIGDEGGGNDVPLKRGQQYWADMFAPRQLLAMGILVEELHRLRDDIVVSEDESSCDAIITLLSFVIDKVANYNAALSFWHAIRGSMANVFDRHDFAFKITFAEMPLCGSGSGLEWAIGNVTKAYEQLALLPHSADCSPVPISQGSATNLLHLDDESVTAVVVDPPYADNVQYSELADFFYVWLKRTRGEQRPEWFSSYLCENAEEAVVNATRHRSATQKAGAAKGEANLFYQRMMTEVFREACRVLRDEGALTVMFTHKQQSAWAALFESLIAAGFTITATWPVQTESMHSLHQAKKNAAQSTVILVARKRDEDAGYAFLDDALKAEIVQAAQNTAARLKADGLNAVDQLVGAFGPAMEVFSRYDQVRPLTESDPPVTVADAIQLAANAVAQWRVQQLAAQAEKGIGNGKSALDGVDAESRFILLCWDVLGATEFRFNEAMMLGRAVGMDVTALERTGLIAKSGDKVTVRTAKDRRREKPVRTEQEQMELFEGEVGASGRRRAAKVIRTVHPQDEYFASAIDMCHALALRYQEAGGGDNGIGAARGMARQQGWGADSVCARMMAALVAAAPPAVRFAGKGKAKTAADTFPEFRAWHSMLQPLFGLAAPDWKPPVVAQTALSVEGDELTVDDEDAEEEGEE